MRISFMGGPSKKYESYLSYIICVIYMYHILWLVKIKITHGERVLRVTHGLGANVHLWTSGDLLKQTCYKIVYNFENDVSTIPLYRIARIGTDLPTTLPFW